MLQNSKYPIRSRSYFKKVFSIIPEFTHNRNQVIIFQQNYRHIYEDNLLMKVVFMKKNFCPESFMTLIRIFLVTKF